MIPTIYFANGLFEIWLLTSNIQYSAKEYLDILVELVRITQTHPQLVSAIGLCNFDAHHTEEACEYLLEKTGVVGLVSNQVQVCDYSCGGEIQADKGL